MLFVFPVVTISIRNSDLRIPTDQFICDTSRKWTINKEFWVNSPFLQYQSLYGGFHSHGEPQNFFMDGFNVRENPIVSKWMMTGGIPMTQETPILIGFKNPLFFWWVYRSTAGSDSTVPVRSLRFKSWDSIHVRLDVLCISSVMDFLDTYQLDMVYIK